MTEKTDIDLICPITLQLFVDPVKAADGYIYERVAITQWISLHQTSPFTRQILQINELIPQEHLQILANEKRNSELQFDANHQIVSLAKSNKYSNRIHPANLPNSSKEQNSFKKHRCQILCGIILSILMIISIILGIGFAMKYSQGKYSKI